MTERPCGPDALRSAFGRIDVYLFDQLLRGRITPDLRILDAGSGSGRNVRYLLACGADVHAVDRDPDAVEAVRALAADLGAEGPEERVRVAELDDLPHGDDSFDVVICSAVLHFARDQEHFEAMVRELWRVLAADGLFFARLASSIGIEDRIVPLGDRRFSLPDSTDRFLVDERYLLGLGDLLGGELLDPVKTTNVQNRRAMTTWVLRKRARADGRSWGSGEGGGGGGRPLAPLLERLEARLYRLPVRTGEEEGKADRDDGPEVWTAEEEAAVEAAARSYGPDVEELAAELVPALRKLRLARTGREDAAPGEEREGPPSPGGDEEPGTYRRARDLAMARLSALRILVSMRDALPSEGPERS